MSPSLIAAIATFPGIIVHEIAHALMCRLAGVRVLKACYLRLGNAPGYVVHEMPSSIGKHVLIGTGPVLINTIAGALLALPFAMKSPQLWLRYGSLWLGVSVAMHSFPSTGDAKSIWQGIWRRGVPFYGRMAAMPVVAGIYVGALGTVLWLDLVYGVAVAFYGPRLLLGWLQALR